MQVSLLDSVLSLRLTQAAQAPLPAGQTGVQGVDTYAPSTSTLTQLSGYGQPLSTASQFTASLATAGASHPSSPQPASSTSPTVATATYGAGSTATNYTLAVSQIATAQTLTSAYFSDPN